MFLAPSCGRILKLACLFLIPYCTLSATHWLSFVFLKLVLQFKFVVSPWTFFKAHFYRCHGNVHREQATEWWKYEWSKQVSRDVWRPVGRDPWVSLSQRLGGGFPDGVYSTVSRNHVSLIPYVICSSASLSLLPWRSWFNTLDAWERNESLSQHPIQLGICYICFPFPCKRNHRPKSLINWTALGREWDGQSQTLPLITLMHSKLYIFAQMGVLELLWKP